MLTVIGGESSASSPQASFRHAGGVCACVCVCVWGGGQNWSGGVERWRRRAGEKQDRAKDKNESKNESGGGREWEKGQKKGKTPLKAIFGRTRKRWTSSIPSGPFARMSPDWGTTPSLCLVAPPTPPPPSLNLTPHTPAGRKYKGVEMCVCVCVGGGGLGGLGAGGRVLGRGSVGAV